jgi:ADP-ribosyl-[dinitrogen reductase] hydrolase
MTGVSELKGPWRKELEVAIAAALAAGERFRREFCRSGGPRGTSGHATIDDEVELDIRRELLSGFDGYGYLGEETGSSAGTPGDAREAGPVWVVDPNDGTSAFQAGYRGASVSIALIDQGRPVLGVVYAYNAPTDHGDIVAWAEGDSLRRWSPGQGDHRTAGIIDVETFTSVNPAENPDSGGILPPVLVSHKADTKALANAEFVYPWRFKAVVGIAFRLALTAVGEGVAAVTLTAPFAWDMAGGHALLRGAGMELYTSDLEVVTYDKQGYCTPSPAYFGGRREVVEIIAWRDWAEIFTTGSLERKRDTLPGEGPDVVLPGPANGVRRTIPSRCEPVVADGTCVPPEVLDRAQGVLLGQCAGDSLGSLVEFRTEESIRAEYPETDGPVILTDGGTWGTIAGQPTDDTEMALLLARSLVAARGYDKTMVQGAYRWWMESAPFDIGITTSAALHGSPSPESQANGALMRASPLGIAAAGAVPPPAVPAPAATGPGDYLTKWERYARTDAAITHVHENCAAVNVLFVHAIARGVAHGPAPGELYNLVVARARQPDIPEEVRRWTESARDGYPEEYSRRQGWVKTAWQNALAQLLNASDAVTGVTDTVRRGGDTDTNGAIAGALLGAVHGASSFPRQWRLAVSTARALPTRRIQRPRPPVLYPVDWDILAERLCRITWK